MGVLTSSFFGAAVAGLAAHEVEAPLDEWIQRLKHPYQGQQQPQPSDEVLIGLLIIKQLAALNKHFHGEVQRGPYRDWVTLQVYPTNYTLHYRGRTHSSLFAMTSFDIALRLPGSDIYNFTLTKGWNQLDLPEGTYVFLPVGANPAVQRVWMQYANDAIGAVV